MSMRSEIRKGLLRGTVFTVVGVVFLYAPPQLGYPIAAAYITYLAACIWL